MRGAPDWLILLVENAGQIVAHRECLREIWGTDEADDRSLRVQIAG
jgi:DNA-binding winged helix-turn-helix (wHTH) protein